MLKKNILIFCLIIVSTLVLSCNKKSDQNTSQTGTQRGSHDNKFPEAPAKIRNTLKGMEIILSNWWANYDPDTFQPRNDLEEKQLEHRRKILQEYNFKMQDKVIGAWNQIQLLTATSIMAGKPAATVFRLQPDWALSLYHQNLLYPVSNSKAVDWTGDWPVAWNRLVSEAFTFNNKTFAFFPGYGSSSQAAVVFWNKRLFREAGLDPNLPYDLQRDGEWTWDKFMEIGKQLTRDINNDGITDTYLMTCDFSKDILEALVSSNGAMFVDKDSKSKLVNASGRPEFIEAIRFYLRMKEEGILKPKPEGAQWNWHVSEFIDGRVALQMTQQYAGDTLVKMKDDWGMVLPPKGPRVNNYIVFNSENVMVIPARLYKDAQIDAIIWAVQAWESPVDDDWRISQYPKFRDRRAVDETMALIRDQNLWQWRYHLHIPGFHTDGIAYQLWWHDGEPAQLVEAVSQSWNALIRDANGL